MSLSNAIETIFRKIGSPNICCQLILWSDADIEEKIQAYAQATSQNSSLVAQACARHKIDYFTKSKNENRENSLCGPRKIRAYFTIRYYTQWNQSSWAERIKSLYLKKASHQVTTDFHKDKRMMCQLAETVKEVFVSNGFKAREIDGSSLAQILYKILNPKI